MLMRGYDGDARSGLPSALERKEKDNIRNNVHNGGSWARSGDRRCITLCGWA